LLCSSFPRYNRYSRYLNIFVSVFNAFALPCVNS
jgi:hypothetical protein